MIAKIADAKQEGMAAKRPVHEALGNTLHNGSGVAINIEQVRLGLDSHGLVDLLPTGIGL